jgi:hypothetical protein
MMNYDAMNVYTPQDHDNAKRRYLQQQRMDYIKREIIRLANETCKDGGIPLWGRVRENLNLYSYTSGISGEEISAAFKDLLLDMQDDCGYYYVDDINGDTIRVMGRDEKRE